MKTSDVISTIIAVLIFSALFFWVGTMFGAQSVYNDAVIKGTGEWAIEYSDKSFSDVHRVFRWKVKP